MAADSTRVLCAQRCGYCAKFGTFRAFVKAEGHFNGSFLCTKCRKKGITFDTPPRRKKGRRNHT